MTKSLKEQCAERRKRVGPLKTATDITREMALLYKEARRGDLETRDLARYGQFLNIMLNSVRTIDLEERIQALEASIPTGRHR